MQFKGEFNINCEQLRKRIVLLLVMLKGEEGSSLTPPEVMSDVTQVFGRKGEG